MKILKVATVTLGVMSLIIGGAGVASADPVNAKKGQILEIQCDGGLGTLTVALNGNGAWTPGHVTTSTQVGVPYRLHLEGSFTPTGGEPEFFVEDIAKKAPRNGRLATCTFHEEEQDEGGTLVLDGTVWISYTPGH
jgi:hypothetical protein